jgi:trk system potassium uptake protein TrkA
MKRCAIIGLGAFGFYLAKSLHEKGLEVLAIDKSKEVVQRVRDFCSRAVIADASEKETLISLNVPDVDFAVVGLGTRLDHSILVTMHLKELGVREIIVKAISDDHAKILTMLGATEVVFPERDMAVKVATSLVSPNLVDHLPIMEGYSIIEIGAPREFIGKSLKDLQLRNTYGVQVIAIRELIPERVSMSPSADFVIKDSDVLILMGDDKALAKISPQER